MDKRDILSEYLQAGGGRPTADAILNALHQGGYAIVRKGPHVNEESTVLVEIGAGRVTVARRGDSDEVWGPPVSVEASP